MTINTVNQQPTAVSLQLTDYLLAWQGGQSPSTRKEPVSGLSAYYLSLAGGTVAGNVTLSSGNLTLSAGNIVAFGNVNVTGVVTVAGNTNITGAVAVVGNTGITGTLGVSGAAEIDGALTIPTPGVSGNHAVNFSQFAPLAAAAGYIHLPGAVTIQWGNGSSSGNQIVTFPVTFSATPWTVVVCLKDAPTGPSPGHNAAAVTNVYSLTQFEVTTYDTTTGGVTAANFFWFAVGPT